MNNSKLKLILIIKTIRKCSARRKHNWSRNLYTKLINHLQLLDTNSKLIRDTLNIRTSTDKINTKLFICCTYSYIIFDCCVSSSELINEGKILLYLAFTKIKIKILTGHVINYVAVIHKQDNHIFDCSSNSKFWALICFLNQCFSKRSIVTYVCWAVICSQVLRPLLWWWVGICLWVRITQAFAHINYICRLW